VETLFQLKCVTLLQYELVCIQQIPSCFKNIPSLCTPRDNGRINLQNKVIQQTHIEYTSTKWEQNLFYSTEISFRNNFLVFLKNFGCWTSKVFEITVSITHLMSLTFKGLGCYCDFTLFNAIQKLLVRIPFDEYIMTHFSPLFCFVCKKYQVHISDRRSQILLGLSCVH
jgi:hypothetical protein